ncbi:DUF5683 domain-containing protein [Aquimarina agarivorans]|uniref:DUF5683 domain-containing protein n=1 Tax=Aquimarina agarivorans TaxID=980584 RepID=UPI000248F86E|nr:DUF5683 domain-containing protein [Aquimarina agarivorans]
MIKSYLLLFLLLSFSPIFSQEISQQPKKYVTFKKQQLTPYSPLTPSKASFYAAILPGLGHAYIKKYWKIPIIYTLLGSGIGITLWNSKKYTALRNEYKNRLIGNPNINFKNYTNAQLIRKQNHFKKQKETAILATAIAYVLNIIDANVSAHLQQHNINNQLSLAPKVKFNSVTTKPNYEVSLVYNF